jgi:hypothetical protein
MQLLRAGFDVTAAAWLKETEVGRWYLFIVTANVQSKGAAAAYSDAYGVLLKMRDVAITMADVVLVGPVDPVARDLITMTKAGAVSTLTRVQLPTSVTLGNLVVEELFIYLPITDQNRPAWRRTRIVGTREELSNGIAVPVEEEIGIVDGVIGDEEFNDSYLQLITAKFGSVDAFASAYASVNFQFLK